jgi:hypothetical protein
VREKEMRRILRRASKGKDGVEGVEGISVEGVARQKSSSDGIVSDSSLILIVGGIEVAGCRLYPVGSERRKSTQNEMIDDRTWEFSGNVAGM